MTRPLLIACLLLAVLSAIVAHDRKAQERELAPVDAIRTRTSETLLSPPQPRRHEWRRRDRA